MDEHQHPDPNQQTESKLPASDYVNQPEPVKKYKKQGKLKPILLIVGGLVVLAIAASLLLRKVPNKTNPTNQSPSGQNQTTQSSISLQTKHYSSNQFRLEFDYPNDWTVKEEASSGTLTATSPTLSLPLAGGSNSSGQVIFTIRESSQSLPEFETGNAIAVLDSEKISYSKPSPAQRGQTHISFLKLANSAGSGSIDALFITGDFGYTKDQDIPKVDIQKIDPIISVTFMLCDGACSQPASIASEGWNDPQFGGALKKMLESLTIN